MKFKLFQLVPIFLSCSVFAQESDLDKILKGVDPLTIRYIKAKTESWSELAPGQIIAQKTIKPIIAYAGYEGKGAKTAVVWTNKREFTGSFELIDLRKNAQPPLEPVVYRGELRPYGMSIWGGNVLIADFSTFTKVGYYKIRLKLDQTRETTDSYPFEIKENVYMSLATKAVEWFGYQRCGTSVPGWYDACHLEDALVEGKTKKMTGGWHDAGDYNKWPIYTPPPLYALSMYHDGLKEMLSGTELGRARNELAWELSFLCKAQKEDGTFYSIISSVQKPWIWAGIPEIEPQRVAVNYNVGNGDPRELAHCVRIAAAVLRGAEIIAGSDEALKDSCLKLAELPYKRGLKTKFNTKTPEKERQNYLSIETGLLGIDLGYASLKNDPSLKKDADERVKRILNNQSSEGYFYSDFEKKKIASWPDLHMVMLYEFNQRYPDDPLKNKIGMAFKKYADYYKSLYKRSPFGNTGILKSDGTYSLITNNKSAGMNAWAFAYAYSLFKDPEYRLMAINNINWILGYNPAEVSMMAGVGVGPGAYHHRYTSIPGHADGVVPGGVLNGIKAGDGGLLFLGDEGAENYVIGDHLPKDYPTIDTDVKGWTYAWWPNEYHIPNNAFFIMAAYMLTLTQE